MATNTALTLSTADPEVIALVKRTIAPDLSNDELALYIHQAARVGLDPLSRHIYAMKIDGRLSITASIDGLRVIAARTGRYAPGKTIYERDENGNLISATTTVKVWHPESKMWMEVEGQAWMSESKRGTKPWQQFPATMLGVRSESRALKKAFPADVLGLMMADERDEVIEERFDAIPVQAEVMPDCTQPPPIPATAEDEPKKRTRRSKQAETFEETTIPQPPKPPAPIVPTDPKDRPGQTAILNAIKAACEHYHASYPADATKARNELKLTADLDSWTNNELERILERLSTMGTREKEGGEF